MYLYTQINNRYPQDVHEYVLLINVGSIIILYATNYIKLCILLVRSFRSFGFAKCFTLQIFGNKTILEMFQKQTVAEEQ